VAIAIGLLGLTLAVLRIVAAAGRVIGWVLAAAVVAGLLHPLVAALSRWIPRGLAVLAVVVTTLATVGGVSYGLVDDVSREMRSLQESAPRAARRIERSGRFAQTAREFDLAERTERFVEEIPDRLRGGTPAQALRSAATRGVAFLATAVLAIFFLLHGGRLVHGGLNQVHDPLRRARLEQVASAAYRRGFGYALGSVAMSAIAGGLTYVLVKMADLPGPAPFALWVALWDLVPLVGLAIGVAPLVVLAAVLSGGWAIAMAVAFFCFQLFEAIVLQRWVERRSVHVGPFLTVAAGLLGLELYGVGGVLLALMLVALIAAALDELAPE
jgi:predicted PurR-regulated permease PerM